MSFKLTVSPLSGPTGLYLLDLTDDEGVPHLWLDTPFNIANTGTGPNPPGVLVLKLDLFRKIPGSTTAMEFVPASKTADIPVISAPPNQAVYERIARTQDGISIDLQEFPMRNRTIPEDYAYILSLEDAPVLRIDFQRINSGIGGVPVVSTDTAPVSVLPPPPLPQAKATFKLGWQPI